VSGLPKAQAEELLDWLEAHDRRGWVSPESGGSTFTVECELPD
jgi:hypothetical protein